MVESVKNNLKLTKDYCYYPLLNTWFWQRAICASRNGFLPADKQISSEKDVVDVVGTLINTVDGRNPAPPGMYKTSLPLKKGRNPKGKYSIVSVCHHFSGVSC